MLRRRIEPRGFEEVAREGTGVVFGRASRGAKETLRVDLVEENIFRVIHDPGNRRGKNERSWMVVGVDGDCDWDGRRRDDLENAFLVPKDKVAEPETNVLECGTVRVELDRLEKSGLVWSANGKEFARDAAVGAYSYEVGGRAWHYMKREAKEILLGLGEVSGPLDRSERRFRMECKDSMGYNPEFSDPLYKMFPFYIVLQRDNAVVYGLLYDHLSCGVFDLGMEISAYRGRYRYYESQAGFVEYYMIVGTSLMEVVEKYGRLVGRAAVPPKWALGYLGSTMTYSDAPDAQQRLQQFGKLCKEHRIPCTGFYLSSGYTMDNAGNRNVFTWNTDRIPRPKEMIQSFHDDGIDLVANVKPWLLHAHPKYKQVEELGGYLVQDGAPHVGWFWKGGPGTRTTGSYLDFTSKAGYEWWKRELTENVLRPGISAVWNDNNEFEVDSDDVRCSFCGNGSSTDGAGIGVAGRALHTLLMGRASYEALKEFRPSRRPLVVSRSGCPGTHRYCAQTWSGDNCTSWHTMKWNIPMSLGLGLCGWVCNGSDIGGFTGDMVTPELFVRWIQLGVLMPRFSIHSSSWKQHNVGMLNNVNVSLAGTNEPWMFPEHVEQIRELIQFRANLMVLLFSLHFEASLTNHPVMRPLAFHYARDANERSCTESFQFLLGRDILVAGVFEPGLEECEVYFPGDSIGEMWVDYHTGEWYEGGTEAKVIAPLKGRRGGGIPMFIRSGGGIVTCNSEFQGNKHANPSQRLVELACFPTADEKLVSVSWYEQNDEDEYDVFKIEINAIATSESVQIQSISGDYTRLQRIDIRLVPNDNRALKFSEMEYVNVYLL